MAENWCDKQMKRRKIGIKLALTKNQWQNQYMVAKKKKTTTYSGLFGVPGGNRTHIRALGEPRSIR